MAKRKRLDPTPLPGAPEIKAAPGSRVPIAQVSGDSSAAAALSEMTEAFTRARAEGRLVQALPLDAVRADHLVRDRIAVDEDALADLIASIRARGQQTPIEVVELAEGYGLISGWRRLEALRRLHAETGAEEFATVLALLRRPAEASEAYQAMVEENEIRLGLSYYERARIAVRAAEAGVYADRQAALRGLFAAASRPRRSKIGAFMTVHDALDRALRFPAAIPERLGLRLAKALEADPALGPKLRERLRRADPADAAAEAALLTRALAPAPDPKPSAGPSAPPEGAQEIRPGVFLEVTGGYLKPKLTISGPKVDNALRERLTAWLREGR